MPERPIVFDGAILAAEPPTGVAASFLATLRRYVPIAEHPCLLLLPSAAQAVAIEGLGLEPGPRGAWRRQLQLPSLLRRLGALLLHCPVAAVPWLTRVPRIATVHDLPWRAQLPAGEPGRRLRDRLATRRAVAAAAAVVVPSQATRADLLAETGGRGGERVHVIPHGIEPPPGGAPAVREGPFLAFGDSRPRKNLDLLRRAHKIAAEMSPGLPGLQILGPCTEGGWVPEADKLAALRRCRALLHVSLHEGFGLPVLEAFAHGAPVVAGEVPALRELGGGVALLVPPRDEQAVARAIVRAHTDPAWRAQAVQAGAERARRYPLQQCAQAWRELHRAVLARKG
jgi:glycosyltransferase involved in cell wall biosynthesis